MILTSLVKHVSYVFFVDYNFSGVFTLYIVGYTLYIGFLMIFLRILSCHKTFVKSSYKTYNKLSHYNWFKKINFFLNISYITYISYIENFRTKECFFTIFFDTRKNSTLQ